MPGPMVPLNLMSKTSNVGKALASAAKPVTDSMCTSESLLSKRIEAIEKLGDLQFIINGYVIEGEGDEHVEEVFDELKRFYLQSRSFFNGQDKPPFVEIHEGLQGCLRGQSQGA